MRLRVLITILQWLTIILIARVLVAIVSNYPDYFPPNFESLFLQGREETFTGAYRIAFYVHITTGPFVLVNGLPLLSDRIRRRWPRGHRVAGWLQVVVLLVFMLPSSAVMAIHAFAGWPAAVSFFVLTIATAYCTVQGVVRARRRAFAEHRRWMLRSYVLIASAIALRLISGALTMVEFTSAEPAYIVAAWASWLVPLAMLEGYMMTPWPPKK